MDQLRQGRPGPRERRSEQGAKLQEEHRASTGLGNPYKATRNVGNADLEPSAWYGRKIPPAAGGGSEEWESNSPNQRKRDASQSGTKLERILWHRVPW